ncbi:MAG: ThuA domain-containing protein [Candidatus Latescibacteria bacterium]|nr:ThuA domain-containing protein [Candidatus Latescibacterota bacterium]
MSSDNKTSRRTALKAGLVSLAGAAAVPKVEAAVRPKKPGETKIVAVMGDYWHPAVSQEQHVREIFSSKKDWKIYFVLASRHLTPELISDADLFISARYGGRDSIGWTDEPVVVDRPQGDIIWTDEQTEAVFDNVRNRGMGWMAVHCTLFSGRKDIEDFIGIEPILHQEIQPCIIRDLNQEHPVTSGIKSFFFNLDEQFDAQIKNPDTTTLLFRSLAVHDKRDAIGGWCLERGKGRVIGLLPGHYQWTYRVPEYQEIFWRAAHWAMNREIPPYTSA